MASDTAKTLDYYITCNECIKLIEDNSKMEILDKEEWEAMNRHFTTCVGCTNYYYRRTLEGKTR